MTTFDTRDMLRILGNVTPHASKDTTAPAINAVRLEHTGGTLTAIATDRYTIATDTAEHLKDTDTGTDFAVSVDLADVKRIMAACKGNKYETPAELNVACHGGSIGDMLTVTLPYTGTSLAIPTVESEFPRWRSLMPTGERTPDAVSVICLDPAYLARFAKVSVDGHKITPVMRLTFGVTATKPVLVNIGETFVALIMPVRLADTDYAVAAA